MNQTHNYFSQANEASYALTKIMAKKLNHIQLMSQ
jgi:hypothetical protein